MKVKICGLKNLSDSLLACKAGADMLGYNFYQASPRYLEIEPCRRIVSEVKANYPNVACVGVFVNQSSGRIQEIMAYTGLDFAQLSGDEPLKTINTLGESGFKVLRPRTMFEAQKQFKELPSRRNTPSFLLDTHHKGAYGGTGQTGNWQLAADLAQQHSFLLAGGLNPDNVAEAIHLVKPWGVDVASGVESARGVKDSELIIEFIKKAKSRSSTSLRS